MGTSPLAGVILHDAGDLDTDEPVDTVLVRDAVFGSALHLADQAAQVRAAWASIAAHQAHPDGDFVYPIDVLDATISGRLGVATASRDRWYALAVRALRDAKVRADGTGYTLRLRIGGCSSDGGRVDFGVIIAPSRASAEDADADGHVIARVSNITSTTPAWLQFDSGLAYVDVTGAVIANALDVEGLVSTDTDIGGDPIAVQVPRVEVIVVAQTWQLDTIPRLHGFVDAEYIG